MHIVTNPGCNLDEDDTIRWEVEVLPQKIVVDGISFDTRGTIDFGKVDGWVKRAAKYPQVQGTKEAEFTEVFSRLAQTDPEVLCVMSSRKIIESHDAAVASVRGLAASSAPKLRAAKVEVVDTQLTDVGMGLCVLAALQARQAKLPLAQTAAFVRRFAARAVNVFGLESLANITRSGRASFLQTWAANFFNLRPLLAFVDGTVASVGRMNVKADMVEKLEEYLTSRLEPGTAVWMAIGHANAPERAQKLARRLQERYRCELTLVRPLSTGIYLNSGPGGLIAFLLPLDGLDFRPTPPALR
jgi:DegV family protein with EDD domain